MNTIEYNKVKKKNMSANSIHTAMAVKQTVLWKRLHSLRQLNT